MCPLIMVFYQIVDCNCHNNLIITMTEVIGEVRRVNNTRSIVETPQTNRLSTTIYYLKPTIRIIVNKSC